jgi:hypothetical protein
MRGGASCALGSCLPPESRHGGGIGCRTDGSVRIAVAGQNCCYSRHSVPTMPGRESCGPYRSRENQTWCLRLKVPTIFDSSYWMLSIVHRGPMSWTRWSPLTSTKTRFGSDRVDQRPPFSSCHRRAGQAGSRILLSKENIASEYTFSRPRSIRLFPISLREFSATKATHPNNQRHRHRTATGLFGISSEY